MNPLDGPGAGEDALRIAERIAADPARAIGHWRAVTGGKAAACLPPVPVPEILHAAGLLPVQWVRPGNPVRLHSLIDAWVVAPDGNPFPGFPGRKTRFDFPSPPPADATRALDLLESLAEWAGNVSGRPVTEGNLWKSIRAYGERNVLLGLLADGEARNLARAGDFLPPEAHCLLLSRYLPAGRQPASAPPEEDRGDPLLVLCRRFAAKNAAGGTGFAGTPAGPRKTC